MAKSKKSKRETPADAAQTKGQKAPVVYPKQDVYTLSNLEQIRILADPLRIRILEALCQERTTKQVAEIIDEKPTKLYHHVEALERVGVIRMTRTRQNRGTLEKYFLAVARRFRTDPLLFADNSEAGPETQALQAIAVTAFDQTSDELRQAIARGDTDLETDGALCYAQIHAPAKTIKRIQTKIEKLMAEVLDLGKAVEDDEADEADEADERRYRLTLAFFPLDKS